MIELCLILQLCLFPVNKVEDIDHVFYVMNPSDVGIKYEPPRTGSGSGKPERTESSGTRSYTPPKDQRPPNKPEIA